MAVLGATPTRNLALELARVTEAAAMLAGRYMGRGDKEGADQAAVNAMRLVLGTLDMNGVIVIGEGEKDQAPMLFNGEKVGNGSAPDVDVAVDPVDGTRPLAFGRSNALAMVALAPRGTMFPFLPAWQPGLETSAGFVLCAQHGRTPAGASPPAS